MNLSNHPLVFVKQICKTEEWTHSYYVLSLALEISDRNIGNNNVCRWYSSRYCFEGKKWLYSIFLCKNIYEQNALWWTASFKKKTLKRQKWIIKKVLNSNSLIIFWWVCMRFIFFLFLLYDAKCCPWQEGQTSASEDFSNSFLEAQTKHWSEFNHRCFGFSYRPVLLTDICIILSVFVPAHQLLFFFVLELLSPQEGKRLLSFSSSLAEITVGSGEAVHLNSVCLCVLLSACDVAASV